MTDEPIDFNKMRHIIEQTRLTVQLGHATKYMFDYYREQEEFMTRLEFNLVEAEKLVSSSVGDATLADLGISVETMKKVGDNMQAARGAFKAAREAMTSVCHYIEDSAAELVADINKAARQDPEE